MSIGYRLFHVIYSCWVRIIARIVNLNTFTVVKMNFVNDTGNCRHKVKVILSLKTFLNYFKVKKSEKTASKAKAESAGGFRFKRERGIIELKLCECFLQVLIICTVSRINTAKNHWIHFSVTGESLFCRSRCKGNGVTDACLRDCFYGGCHVTYFARS